MEDLVTGLKDFYSKKRVLVTGHTGFKGTWLTRALLLLGADVTGYALGTPTNPSLYTLTDTSTKVSDVRGDVRDLNALKETFNLCRPEVVFHLAAQPIVRESYLDPVETYSTNVMGTVNIMEATRYSSSVKSVVNITTDKVYENKEWLWGYRENDNLCGYDPYSNSKSCSELVTFSYKQAFFSSEDFPAISTARSGNVIGGGDFAKDRIIPDCVRAVLSNKEIIVRNPHSIRPYQHVLECLTGYLLLAKLQAEDKTYAGSYNFGPNDDGCVTTGALVQLFCDTWGNGATWRVLGDGGPHEANFLKLDCSKAKTALGWRSKWSIGEAVRNTVHWYKDYELNIDLNKSVDSQISSFLGI